MDAPSAARPEAPAAPAVAEEPDGDAVAIRSKRIKRQPTRKVKRKRIRRIRRKPVQPPPSDPPKDEPSPIPGPLAAEARTALLTAHNAARAQVGVQALTWSDEVAETARRWAGELAANGCGLQHNPNRSYGENLYWTTVARNGTQVTEAWTSEAAHYDAQDHSCADGHICGHYTQVVWANTTKLGCGMATCGSTQVWVCNYDPPGNYTGQTPF